MENVPSKSDRSKVVRARPTRRNGCERVMGRHLDLSRPRRPSTAYVAVLGRSLRRRRMVALRIVTSPSAPVRSVRVSRYRTRPVLGILTSGHFALRRRTAILRPI